MVTDDQIVVMTQQYTVTRDGEAYICHLGYEEINRQVKNGRPWSKCMDCGTPFPLDSAEAIGSDFCSTQCEYLTLDYMNNEAQAYLNPMEPS